MKLSIYSLQKTLFEGEVEKIIARTTTGEITVLDGHIPLISSLRGPGLELIDKKGKKDIIKIDSGFLEIRPESEVVILADTA
ncbi:MAG: hypothetical protein A3G49_06435 [Candidatus Sungbacteria bacterium RIFCSPLOWO2_12_FULL_41_11]|uniref:ATP synthase F1 complex delta/epsilon subunit N-terminal domain-containing protein n=1 Tax=Candidatus Sungbacteria bacterium RIFCSPLOWO2_12_FULL_41_11 TaxID=1802286 RepID=A0A1G2LS84_9BACT|nr:MAG: ATP synthase subunit epsilon [Parcubacteria group bacterium GW2011_GWA2_42_14]OGZ99487.1 MAG: hypothetical protein A3D41_05885 [Candidatus Sungbacteria bacterium RIFCSPHIGHO2_02_FULL_41_12b]OHA14457.1 MAG: hypothetical protein A3G49_06435 [Candidatus Sungbacteria bacterium RIFCSPLOWO2_12_FULL_41_11]